MLRNAFRIPNASPSHTIRAFSTARTLRKAVQSTRHTSPKASTAAKEAPAQTSLIARANSLLFWTIASFIAVHVFTSYFYSLRLCEGISMLPTINSYGDWVLISKHYRRGRNVKVGDLVSFHHPVYNNMEGVKRVVGMEGDFVLRDTPGSSDVMIQIPRGHCWVVGDNLKFSRDSRHFGALPMALVKGKVVARVVRNYKPQMLGNGLVDADENDYDVD